MDDPRVILTFTDKSVTISSDNSSHTNEWERMTKLSEINGFLLFFTSKLLTISIPGESLSNEQLEFIRSKMDKKMTL